ncbi:crotonase/enoyl-CoA hydratase family protein [Fluviibacterium sp. DFM31]|uniref:Crotonase/enoyl-CoA hydratase family protein n=1 Tax=Meridianimarinicoccus marinus TaxID=3231483 RepID=A0ABV3L5J9_9RHOB
MNYDTLDIQSDARGVTTLTLDRADKRNALSPQMIAELTVFAEAMRQDRTTRVVVLRGAGSHFCAGADLGWMKAQIESDRVGRMSEARKLAGMLKALNDMPKPLIGQLHGGAFGGGVGLACVCDVVLADPDTAFGLTETRLGLIPATIGPYVAARLGEGMARRVFMSARIFGAGEARDLGLVARVVAADAMPEAVEAEIAPYLKTAMGAVGAAKSLLRRLGPPIDAVAIDTSIEALADTWETAEAAAGIAAFLDKRPAPWAG